MFGVLKSSYFPDLEKQHSLNKRLSNKDSFKEASSLPLLESDVFLCASNIISLTSNFMINQGLRGMVPLALRNLSALAVISGESFASIRNLNTADEAVTGIALSVARIFVLSQMQSNPLMKPVALAMNAYGTFCVVQRAFTELQKCWQLSKEDSKQEHTWQIVRNSLVHGVNASCSVYNMASIFSQCISDLFPRPEYRYERNEHVPNRNQRFRGNSFSRRADPKPSISEEMPTIKQSQISEEVISPKESGVKVTMVSASDNGIKKYADLVAPNQRAFAQKNGYGYARYSGNLSNDRAPYWSKIVAIWDQLQKTKEGEWIAWVDASAVITNTDKKFEQVIKEYGHGKSLILTTDPQIPINNAVFLIKNTEWTKGFIQKVWSRTDLAVGGQGNCGTSSFPHCHYEQQSMTELWERAWNGILKHAAVIPNRNMNSFYRYSHYDAYRNMHLNYNDPDSSKWTSGDFVCKVTGMDKDRRLNMIKYVLNNCVDKACRVPTSD